MDNLFVLHRSPRNGVQLLADVHLRPSLKTAIKIASSSLLRRAPGEVKIEKSVDGIRAYTFEGSLLVPPFKKENIWVDWVCKDQQHFWWIVEMAWHCDRELTYRFDLPQSKEYVHFSKIIEKGAARYFPKTENATIHDWPWPATGSLSTDSSDGNDNEIALHKDSYREIQGVKMEWTRRTIPEFFLSTEQKLLFCPDCGALPPKKGICNAGCYYERN